MERECRNTFRVRSHAIDDSKYTGLLFKVTIDMAKHSAVVRAFDDKGALFVHERPAIFSTFFFCLNSNNYILYKIYN